MGGTPEPTITQAPTMDPKQTQLLLSAIQGVLGGIQGFPLGEAYGGPSLSSYRPNPFMGGGIAPGAPSGGGDGEKEGFFKPVYDLFEEMKGGEPKAMATAQPTATPVISSVLAGNGGGIPAPMPKAPIAGTSLPANLTPVPKAPVAVKPPPGEDPMTAIITELLASPLIAPFREEMTGNYEKTGRAI